MDEYLGIIKLFAGTYAPEGWAFCDGRVLNIANNTALFSILGTTYGGDGQNTFALPDLRGAVPIGAVGGIHSVGQKGGSDSHTLIIDELPSHSHTPSVTQTPALLNVSSDNSDQTMATSGVTIAAPGSISGGQFHATYGFNKAHPDTALNAGSISGGTCTVQIQNTGGGKSFSLMQPYLAMNYIICTEGIYPPRG